MYQYRNPGQTRADLWARVVGGASIALALLGVWEAVASIHNFFVLGSGALLQLLFGGSFILCGVLGVRASRSRSVLLASHHVKVLALVAVLQVAFVGIGCALAVAYLDCNAEFIEIGEQKICQSRFFAFVGGVLFLLVWSACCGLCLFCAKSFQTALQMEAWGAPVPTLPPLDVERFESDAGSTYAHMPLAATPPDQGEAERAAAASAFPRFQPVAAAE